MPHQGVGYSDGSMVLIPVRDYWVNWRTGEVHDDGCPYLPEVNGVWLGSYLSLEDAVAGAQVVGCYDPDPCYWCWGREFGELAWRLLARARYVVEAFKEARTFSGANTFR